jgi:flagellar motor switch protein FliM
MEIRIGDVAGMMNVGIPSILIKMLRQKFDQQWSIRRSESTEEDRERLYSLIEKSQIKFDARLSGPKLTVEQMLALQQGDVLEFDYPVNRPTNLVLNGRLKFKGSVGTQGTRRAFRVETICQEPD